LELVKRINNQKGKERRRSPGRKYKPAGIIWTERKKIVLQLKIEINSIYMNLLRHKKRRRG